jgi:hypothetical protein
VKVLMKLDGKSKHEVLFMYGGASPPGGGKFTSNADVYINRPSLD